MMTYDNQQQAMDEQKPRLHMNTVKPLKNQDNTSYQLTIYPNMTFHLLAKVMSSIIWVVPYPI